MAKVKFSHDYEDYELERKVKAKEPVDMTLKRADEIVEKIRGQALNHPNKGYEQFGYERVEENKE